MNYALVAQQLDAVEQRLCEFVATADHEFAAFAARAYASETSDALRLALGQGAVVLEGQEAGRRAVALLQRCRGSMQRGGRREIRRAWSELTAVMNEIGAVSLAMLPASDMGAA